MENLIKNKVYHTTKKEFAIEILKTKYFKESVDKDDWLGTGIYFWHNIEDANWWKNQIKSKEKEKTTILAQLKCEKEHYRDLNNEEDFKEYIDCCKEIPEIKDLQVEIKDFKVLRNLYCNYYKEKKGIKVISYNFPVKYKYDYGFEKRARQYCVGGKYQQEILEIKGECD